MEPLLYAAVKDRLDRLDPDVPGDTRGGRALLAALATERCLRTGRAAQLREWSRRAFQRGLLDDQSPYSSLWGNAAFPLIFADGFAEATRLSTRAIEDARRRGSPIGSARAHAVRSMLHFRQGALRDAESDGRTAAELGLHAGFLSRSSRSGCSSSRSWREVSWRPRKRRCGEAGRNDEIPERFLDNWVLHGRGWLRLAQRRTRDSFGSTMLSSRKKVTRPSTRSAGFGLWSSNAERPTHTTEYLHHSVDDGVVLDGHVGLAGDRSDARHDGLLSRDRGFSTSYSKVLTRDPKLPTQGLHCVPRQPIALPHPGQLSEVIHVTPEVDDSIPASGSSC